MWSRFSCTFTTFTRRGVGRDVNFEVLVLGPERFGIRGARWVKARPRAAGVLAGRSSRPSDGRLELALLIVLAVAISLLGVSALPRQAIPHGPTATLIVRRRTAFAAAGLAVLAAFIVSYFVT